MSVYKRVHHCRPLRMLERMTLASLLTILAVTSRAPGQETKPAFGSAQPATTAKHVAGDNDWAGTIAWRSGAVATTAKTASEVATVARDVKAVGQSHLVVQFDRPLDSESTQMLETNGLQLLDYLGGNAYFAVLTKPQMDEAVLANAGLVMDVKPIQRDWKLHPILARGEIPEWVALQSSVAGGVMPDEDPVETAEQENPVVALYVVFHSDVDLATRGTTIATQYGATVQSMLNTINAMVVEMPFDEIASLADADEVQWIEPALPSFTGLNDGVRDRTEADDVQVPPYNLDGSGITLMIYDVGAVDASHPDLAGRVILGDISQVSEHSTHVAGTACGDGTDSGGTYRGMAPATTAVSYGISAWTGTPFYTDPLDIEQDYYDAIYSYGADLATNSVGSNTCSLQINCEITGNYGVASAVIDAVIRGELGRPIITTWANGNERSCERCRGVPGGHTDDGYHSTAPPSCAKNHIAVGAVNSDNDTITTYTSFGPTDDGRIKPDIVAPGDEVDGDGGVTSCKPGGGYVVHAGTSMATPAVAGCLSLFLQDFYAQHPGSPAPLNSTAKVLLAHSAVDLGNPGPDYQFGYGSIRIREMIDFARQGFFFQDEVGHGGTYSFLVRVDPGESPLKVTLAWDDVPGTPNVDPALVNDLDLVVRDPLGQRHYPWTLDAEEPGDPAVRDAEDHTNNIEQVVVDAPVPGLWEVEVSGYYVLQGEVQLFSICASPNLSRDCDEDGVPDDEEILGDPMLDCTGNGILDTCEPDCNGNGIADSCDIDGGTSDDCDSNGVPDECQPDCNANDIADICDIDAGTSADCDRNLVPDECQDTSADCNGNGIWDPCDILADPGLDLNHNGLIDECEDPDSRIHVDDDAPNDPGPGDTSISDPAEDGSLAHPYDSIQEAIDVAIDHNTIIVHDGIYAGYGNVNLTFHGKEIELKNENGPSVCIIDGEGVNRGFLMDAFEPRETVIEGITVRNGYDGYWGGAVQCSASMPTFRNCVFEGCWGTLGGAVYIHSGAPLFEDCTFSSNRSCRGGGVYSAGAAGAEITGCVFEDNEAQYGGAFHCDGYQYVTVSQCRFARNAAVSEACQSDDYNGCGGAAYLRGQMDAFFLSCVFETNTAEAKGGAVYANQGCNGSFLSCVFLSNEAGSIALPEADGGAVYAAESPILLSGCTLSANSATQNGGGLVIQDALRAVVASSLFWGNSDSAGATESSQIFVYGDTPGVSFCCVQGLTDMAGNGNIGDDPLLAPDGYHLTLGSRCLNHGDPAFSGADHDIDGDARVLLGRVDIGADEFLYAVVDCNNNGNPDEADIAKGVSEDCNANGIPDECEIDYTMADDCNENGIPDGCDIESGFSEDCDGDTVADECQDTSLDCDGNGIWDYCDLSYGTHCDRNENLVPDICEVPHTIYVDDDAPCDPGPRDPTVSDPSEDGSEDHPFDAIQEAIDASIDGDLILLADGLYAGTGNRDITYGERAIAVRSVHGPFDTVIDCEQSGRGVFFDEADSDEASLAGITITNGIAVDGGALYCNKANPHIVNCVLVGNRTSDTSTGCGGGLRLNQLKQGKVANCLIAGNLAGCGGGVASRVASTSVGSPISNIRINGCTVVNNHATDAGGGLHATAGITDARTHLVNSIVWGNTSNSGQELYARGLMHDIIARYTDMSDAPNAVVAIGLCDIIFQEGNIATLPSFMGGDSGMWSAVAVYDGLTHQTTFVDTTATWQANSLAGKLLEPNTSEWPCCLIAGNTATTVSVWGDFSGFGLAGAGYQVHDFRLASDSPCIDAGGSHRVLQDELDIDGDVLVDEHIQIDIAGIRRFTDDPNAPDTGLSDPPLYPEVVDMGAFEFGLFADLNGDCAVDSLDQQILLDHYGQTGCPLTYEDGDLNNDGFVTLSDLAALLGVYGTTCSD